MSRCHCRKLCQLLFLAVCMAAGLARAQAEQAACGPYRVGLKLYPQVYERVPGSEEYRGLDHDFFALLAQRSGCSFRLELESQPRIWSRLRNGSLDISSWVVPTAEREPWVTTIALVRVNLVAVTWAAQGVRSEAEFLARKELLAVAVRDTSHGPDYELLLQRLKAENRVAEAADVDSALRVFLARRLGLFVTYPWVVAGPMRELPAGELQLADWHPASAGVLSALALSKQTVPEADQRRLLLALQALQRDGSLARLLRQHLPRVGVHPLTRIEMPR